MIEHKEGIEHTWGDEWFDKYGIKLYAAERYLYKFVKYSTGCSLMSKEKYGTIRYEAIFPPYGAYYRHNNLIDRFLLLFGSKIIRYSFNGKEFEIVKQRFTWTESFIYRLWFKLGRFSLGIAIKIACIKYPEVKEELLDDWDDSKNYLNS